MLNATTGMTPLVTVGNDADNKGVALENATLTVTNGGALLSGQDKSGRTRQFDGDATVVFSTC